MWRLIVLLICASLGNSERVTTLDPAVGQNGVDSNISFEDSASPSQGRGFSSVMVVQVESKTTLTSTRKAYKSCINKVCRVIRCSEHANLVNSSTTGRMACQCKPGYAGNGTDCGPDQDQDGVSDIKINCMEPSCGPDNCPTVPNPDQADVNINGVGDACEPKKDGDPKTNEAGVDEASKSQRMVHRFIVCDKKQGTCNVIECDAEAALVKDKKFGNKTCQCKPGFAGNGAFCGNDTDNDGFPDVKLDCDALKCRQDNCPTVPNPGQEDSDKNGVGDECENKPIKNVIKTRTKSGNTAAAPIVIQLQTQTTKAPARKAYKSCVKKVCTTVTCHENALITNATGRMSCQCKPGFAGNGTICGIDTDSDGFSDEALPCATPNCKKDNCPEDPNPGQEDSDKDGIGDLCDFKATAVIKTHKKKPKTTTTLAPIVVDIEEKTTLAPVQLSYKSCVKNTCQTVNCSSNAKVNTTNGKSTCECNEGFAGNGILCGVDTDQDGFPDAKLNCPDLHCKKDNCPDVPNEDQEDSNSNGIGDDCDEKFVKTVIMMTPKKATTTPAPVIVQLKAETTKAPVRVGYKSCVKEVCKTIICDRNAKITNSTGKMSCECNQGFAGNGIICGIDSDSDGIPSEKLNCTEPSCKKDNCPNISNPGQEDVDKNGVGDACDEKFIMENVIVMKQKKTTTTRAPVLVQLVATTTKAPARVGYKSCVKKVCSTVMCDRNAKISKSKGKMSCQCKPGFAGNGVLCGLDSDQDGVPNLKLNCSHPSCKQDNCPEVPNPDQEDADGNGIGDDCDKLIIKNVVHLRPKTSTTTQAPIVVQLVTTTTKAPIRLAYKSCIKKVCKTIICDPNAKIDNSTGKMSCQCKLGFIGNGLVCGVDTDKDGYPDENLNCTLKYCSKDNCPFVPNPDQQDKDKNGVGDLCESLPTTTESIEEITFANELTPATIQSIRVVSTTPSDEIIDAGGESNKRRDGYQTNETEVKPPQVEMNEVVRATLESALTKCRTETAFRTKEKQRIVFVTVASNGKHRFQSMRLVEFIVRTPDGQNVTVKLEKPENAESKMLKKRQIFDVCAPDKLTFQLPIAPEPIPIMGRNFTFHNPDSQVKIEIPSPANKHRKVVIINISLKTPILELQYILPNWNPGCNENKLKRRGRGSRCQGTVEN